MTVDAQLAEEALAMLGTRRPHVVLRGLLPLPQPSVEEPLQLRLSGFGHLGERFDRPLILEPLDLCLIL